MLLTTIKAVLGVVDFFLHLFHFGFHIDWHQFWHHWACILFHPHYVLLNVFTSDVDSTVVDSKVQSNVLKIGLSHASIFRSFQHQIIISSAQSPCTQCSESVLNGR